MELQKTCQLKGPGLVPSTLANLQLLVTPAQGDPMPLASKDTHTHMYIVPHRHIYIHIIKIMKINLKENNLICLSPTEEAICNSLNSPFFIPRLQRFYIQG